MVDLSTLRYKLKGRPISGICDVLPPKAVAAIADSLIDGAIVGVIFYPLDEREKLVSPGLNFSQINPPLQKLGKAVFSLADRVDAGTERDRINGLLGADVMSIGADPGTLQCRMADLYALEMG